MIKLLLFALFISTPFAFADDIVMTFEQSEYYFIVGQKAIISLDIENNYDRQITGILQYSISQQVQQGNVQFSSSNAQTAPFVIGPGNQTGSLDFGSSNSPSTLTVNLDFNYNDGDAMHISFDPIKIHFVSDESEQNNEENETQSSSQPGASENQSPNLEQQLNELNQNPQQKLQNSQLPQDSSALKQEILEQIQEENQLKNEFEKLLFADEEFSKLHNELLEQGYNVTSANLNPSSNNTGDFQINYENKQEKWARITGSMTNATITDIDKQSLEQQERLLLILQEDLRFQKYHDELTQEEFLEQNVEFLYDDDITISLKYQDQTNQTATISANFENEELIEVTLQKPSIDYPYALLLLFPIAVLAYILYRKFKVKKSLLKLSEYVKPPKFDHALASKNLIIDAKKDYSENQFKDAYGKISQAVRLYLSYEFNLNKEITNEEIILYLQDARIPIEGIEACFKLSSLVEFAKHKEDEAEFERIIDIAETVICRKFNNSK